jgi:hypothetical protein
MAQIGKPVLLLLEDSMMENGISEHGFTQERICIFMLMGKVSEAPYGLVIPIMLPQIMSESDVFLTLEPMMDLFMVHWMMCG